MVSPKVIQFLKHESKDSVLEKGTEEFSRSVGEIRKKLNEGKEVLTVLNKKPVLISKKGSEVIIKNAEVRS